MHLCAFSTEGNQAVWTGPQVSSCSHDRQAWAADLPLLERVRGGARQGTGAGRGSRCFQIQCGVSQGWTQCCLRNAGQNRFWSNGAFREAVSAALLCGTVPWGKALPSKLGDWHRTLPSALGACRGYSLSGPCVFIGTLG